MSKQSDLNKKRERRAIRSRAKLFGTLERPRLSVHKSNAYVYLQMIDDESKTTLVNSSTQNKKGSSSEKIQAMIAELISRAQEKKITSAVLDRGKFRYHGIIKIIAEEARKGGIKI